MACSSDPSVTRLGGGLMVDPVCLMLAWTVGMYGFCARWRWKGGLGFAVASLPLMFPILY